MAEIHLNRSNQLELVLESSTGAQRSVIIPLTVDGLKIIQQVLRHRDRPTKPKIGEPGAPTQWEIDEWLRSMRQAQQRKIAEKKISDLGIDLSDIQL